MKDDKHPLLLRIPAHLMLIIDTYVKNRGVSLNKFFTDVVCKEIANDSAELSEQDRCMIKERYRNSEIERLRYLRKRNLAEAWSIPKVIEEMKKMFLLGDYIDEVYAQKNLDLSIDIAMQGNSPKKSLLQLLPAMVMFQNQYGWKYGVFKVKMVLKKLNVDDPTIEKIASSPLNKESLQYKRKKFEKKNGKDR